VDENIRVTLVGQTAYETLQGQYETLYDSISGETGFTVPEDLVMVRWLLYAPKGTVVECVGLSDGQRFQLGYPLLPGFIADRLLQGMGNSFTLRVEFDKDAWKIFSTAPLLGRGLGSTENLGRSVQSFQYESKYAHNHLLQTMSDTGLVGTVFALAFVLGSAWLCLQAVRKEKDSLAAALLAYSGREPRPKWSRNACRYIRQLSSDARLVHQVEGGAILLGQLGHVISGEGQDSLRRPIDVVGKHLDSSLVGNRRCPAVHIFMV